MIRHFWLSSSFFLFLWNKDVYGNFFIPKMFKGLQKLCCRKPQLYVTEKVLRFAQRHLESSRGTSCSCALQGSIALDQGKPCYLLYLLLVIYSCPVWHRIRLQNTVKPGYLILNGTGYKLRDIKGKIFKVQVVGTYKPLWHICCIQDMGVGDNKVQL